MIFVDTNYFLRLLLGDQEPHHKTAKHLFTQAAKGQIDLFTSLVVFFEIYWVLSSFYKKNKQELIEKLSGILQMKFVTIQSREVIESAMAVFKETSLDFEDAYNLVYASSLEATEFKTFDKKLGKIFSK